MLFETDLRACAIGTSVQRVDYDQRQHRVYHDGRRLSEPTAEQWLSLFSAYAPKPPPLRWLDVGAGTGRFSALLAEQFGAEVIGIEPSARMRDQAWAHNSHPRVDYRAGAAEAIAEPDASFDAALISMVYHHLSDARAAFAEIRRVLSRGARLFVRSALRDRHLDSTFYDFFEAARRIDEERLPALADIRACALCSSFTERHHEVVRQVTDATLTAFELRMRARPFSTFELMSECEIEAGFSKLTRAIAENGSLPAIEYVDLVVFEAQ